MPPKTQNWREYAISSQIGEIVKSQYLSRIKSDHDAILFVYSGLRSVTENMQIRSNGVKGQSHVTYFKFWDRGTLVAYRRHEVLIKNMQIKSNCVMGRGHVTYF